MICVHHEVGLELEMACFEGKSIGLDVLDLNKNTVNSNLK